MQKNSSAMILVAFLILLGGGIGAWALFSGGDAPKKTKEAPKTEAAASEDETPVPAGAPVSAAPSSSGTSEVEKPAAKSAPEVSDAVMLGRVVRGEDTSAAGGLNGLTVVLVDDRSPGRVVAETTTSAAIPERAKQEKAKVTDGALADDLQPNGWFSFALRPSTTQDQISHMQAALVSRGYAVKVMNGGGSYIATSLTRDPNDHRPDAPTQVRHTSFGWIRATDASTLEATVLNADEKDAPMEGASVNWTADPLYASLLARYNGVKDGDPAKLLTDSQGMLALGGLPPAEQAFVAAKKGYSGTPFGAAVNRAEIKFKTGATEKFTFRLTQSGILVGRVVIAAGPATVTTDAEGKEITTANLIPVADAVVELGEGLGDKVDSVISDSEGKFRFESVPAIKIDEAALPNGIPRGARQQAGQGLVIRIAKPGTGHGQKRNFIVKSSEVTDVGDITLKVGAALTGIVQDDKGNPVAGAEVAVVESGGLPQAMMKNIGGIRRPRQFLSTKSGPDGRFSLDPVPAVPPPEASSVATPPADPNAQPSGAGTGRGPGGRNRGPGGFGNMFGGTELMTTARTFSSDLQKLPELNAGEKRELTIVLKPGAVISGIVVDEKNYPIPGVAVGVARQENEFMTGMFENMFGQQNAMPGMAALKTNIESGADGTFEIGDVEPGQYVVVGTHPQLGRASVKDVEAKAGEVSAQVRLVMKVQSAIYGHIYDNNQKPKAHAKVIAFVFAMPPKFATGESDEKGYYEIAGLAPGSYTVKQGDMSIMNGGMALMMNINPSERVSVPAGGRVEHDVFDRTPGTVTVWGRVTEDGAPYTGSLAWGGFGFDGISMKTVQCDEKGEYRVENVTPGSYDVIKGTPGPGGGAKLLQPFRAKVEKEPGEQQIDIQYTTITITGIVVMTDGGALEDDTIVYASPVAEKNSDGAVHPRDYFRSQIAEQVKPDLKSGAYEIKGLAPGAYYVSARSKKGGYKRVGPLKLEKSTGGVRLELSALTGTLEGTVENFVQRNDSTNPMSGFLDAVAVLTFEDDEGNVVTLGNTSGNPMAQDNGVQLQPDDNGVVKFTKVGFPAGTWTITMQVNNYAPVTLKNIVIGPDAPANARFVLAASGDVEIQITNTDLAASAAQDISYTIKDSRGGTYIKRFTFLDLMNNMLNPPSAGKKNTFVLKDFPPDTYTMTMTLPGYRPETRKFTVFSKNLTPVSYTFQSDGSGK